MFALSQWPLLLAADNRVISLDLGSFGPASFQIPGLVFLVLGIIVAAYALGVWLANLARMKDYGWKVGLILATFAAALSICLFGQYKLGVDLSGGVILVYEVNEEETQQLVAKDRQVEWSMSRLVGVLSKRLNDTGLKEIVVRPFGPKQVEIVVPEVDENEIKKLKEVITTGGTLQFMVVATEIKDAQLFELAKERAANPTDPENRNPRQVVDDEGNQIGFWARMGREQLKTNPETAPFREPSVMQNGLVRDARTGTIIDLPAASPFYSPDNHTAFQQFLSAQEIKDIDVLMAFDSEYSIRGETDLGQSATGIDEGLRPCIHFSMRGEGVFKMGNLTARNLKRRLAIIFDNELTSAPVINSKIDDRGIIEGNFSQEEVQFIVDILKSGSLPVVLHKQPLSENTIGSMLGNDTIVSGRWSITGALAAVFVFLIVYYRFAGLVAGMALTLNILMTVAFMVMFQAPFTLPGLAGLVLTVGMSVDANVLIFERMREEHARGAALRMTIRNGFDRALSAIIDGNLTTLFTAIVLYAIGTDQVRGFGATLILGNLTSMFTAIFCSRVVFDMAERTRWLTRISMAQLLPTPSIDWCKLLAPAMVISAVVIAIGLGATVARGRGILDIDLNGGTSVTVILKVPVKDDQVVRDKVEAVLSKEIDPQTNGAVSYSVNEVTVRGEPAHSVYRIDSSLPDVTKLQAKLREAFRVDGQEGLRTFQMTVASIDELKQDVPPAETKPATTTGAGTPGAKSSKDPAKEPAKEPTVEPKASATVPLPTVPGTPPDASSTTTKPSDPKPEVKKEGEAAKPESSGCQDEPKAEAPAKLKSDEKPADKPNPDERPVAGAQPPASATLVPPTTPPLSTQTPTTPPVAGGPVLTAPPSPATSAVEVETKAVLDFPQSAITESALRERLLTSGSAVLNRSMPIVDIYNPKWDGEDNSAFEQWEVTLRLSKADAQKVLDHMQAGLADDVVWQGSSKIGGQVSEDTRWRAVGAMAVSLLLILAYVWFRFHEAIWGVAAIVALAHDALVMLGGIAVSYWLVGILGWAQVEEFKISLPVVAAFLTLIGYSVNDTIVIFDRIREIRGKSPDVTAQMINDSVNQTLSRTIITGGLVLMVVVVLYFFGGSGIHAFAFSLVVGVISGSYSTVFIAAPLLLWLLGKKASEPPKMPAREMAKTTA